jgi:hypothetical protein
MAMAQKLMTSPAKDDNTMEPSVFFVTNGKLYRCSAGMYAMVRQGESLIKVLHSCMGEFCPDSGSLVAQ